MARPSKYDAAHANRIVKAIRAGNGTRTAAQLAGIDPSTLFDWQSKLPEFSERIRKARAEAEDRRVRLVERASRKNWRAAAWMLERQNPEEWGQRVIHLVKEAFGAALERLELELDRPTFERVAGILAGLDGAGAARPTSLIDPGGGPTTH